MSLLRIKAKQIASLSVAVDERLERRLAEHLATLFGEADTSELTRGYAKGLNGYVREGIVYTDQHDFQNVCDVAQVLSLLMACRLSESASAVLMPWGREVLERDESSAMTRLAWIRHRLQELAATNPDAARLADQLTATRSAFE